VVKLPASMPTSALTSAPTSAPAAVHSLWRANASNAFTSASLEGHVSTDVAIIGGGYSGLSAALHLAQNGVDVQLCEAHSVGFGGSGRNVGLVNAGLWTPPDEVEAKLGKFAGEQLNQALAGAPELVFELIQQHNIDCHPVRSGTLHCATNSAGLRDLKQRLAQQLKRQAPVQLLGSGNTEYRTGSQRFLGALFDPRAGTIQPLAYAYGLAHAAINAGANIHSNSQALSYVHDGKQWQITTANGSISANQLIVASNAYNTQSQQQAHFTPVNYCQFATASLSAKQRSLVLPQGEGCWDTAQVMSSFRLDASGRLILGGVGSLEDQGGKIHIEWARRKLKHLFPRLANYEFEYMWSGRIAMTADHLPRMASIGPKGLSLYGYSGRGIGPGTLLGKAAANWAMGVAQDQLPLAISQPTRESYTRLKAAYYETGATLTHWLGQRF